MYLLILLAVLSPGAACVYFEPSGETHPTVWRPTNQSEGVRLPAMTPVFVAMGGSGPDSEKISKFSVTGLFPDAMFSNRLEDVKREEDFVDGLTCAGVPVVTLPEAGDRKARRGSPRWAICAAGCGGNAAAHPQCNSPALFRETQQTCNRTAECENPKAKERRFVAGGFLDANPRWGHLEWTVRAPSPVRVLGSALRGIVLETYLPAEAVGKSVEWFTVSQSGVEVTGVTTLNPRLRPESPASTSPPKTSPSAASPVEHKGSGPPASEPVACTCAGPIAALVVLILVVVGAGLGTAGFVLWQTADRDDGPAAFLRSSFRRAPTDEKDAADAAKALPDDCFEL